MKFNIGDAVERLIYGSDGQYEEGYTVIEPPENPFPDVVYIEKPNSRGFKRYYCGVPVEHLRRAPNPKID